MKTVADLHRQAMELADRALLESLRGLGDSGAGLYKKAFDLERQAALEARLSSLGEPTVSILHRSAATLALDAGEIREAERLVASALAHDPPDELADELRDLLEQVHFRRHLGLRGLRLNPGEFQFAMAGAAVGFGIVASDEFVDRVQNVERVLYRMAERKLKRPFRERGQPTKALRAEIDLYLSVPRAASFAVTFKIGSSAQLPLWENGGFGDELVNEVITCFEMLDRGQDELIRQRIPEPSYYRNFMALAEKIAPDGKQITGVGFTTQSANGAVREVALRRLRKSLSAPAPEIAIAARHDEEQGVPVTIQGRLEWASELRQENEIRIQTRDGAVYRVLVPTGMMADIVKPLWSELVMVSGARRSDDVIVLNKITLIDER